MSHLGTVDNFRAANTRLGLSPICSTSFGDTMVRGWLGGLLKFSLNHGP
jgi:hypothetical protein